LLYIILITVLSGVLAEGKSVAIQLFAGKLSFVTLGYTWGIGLGGEAIRGPRGASGKGGLWATWPLDGRVDI